MKTDNHTSRMLAQSAKSFCRAICALVFATLPQTAAFAAPGVETLAVETRCPNVEPYRACLHVSIIPWPMEEADVGHHDRLEPIVRVVRGRLGEGAPRRYRVAIVRREEDYRSIPEVAYLGQSTSGHVVVLTSKGPLEILSKGYEPASQMRAFFDERTWRPLDLGFLATSSGPTVVTSLSDIGVWDSARNLCVSGVIPKRERLRVLEHGCHAHPDVLPEPGTQAYAALMRERAAKLPSEVVRWTEAWFRGRAVGLSPKEIIEINTPITSDPGLENPIGAFEPFEVSGSLFKRLVPASFNPATTSESALSSFFVGKGVEYDVERLVGTHVIMFTTLEDDC